MNKPIYLYCIILILNFCHFSNCYAEDIKPNNPLAQYNHLIIAQGDAQLLMECPPRVQVEYYGDVPPRFTDFYEYEAAGGSAFSACGLDTLSFAYDGETVSYDNCPITITRTYSLKDSCGHTMTCEHIIIVHDKTPPVMSCPDTIKVLPYQDVPLPYIYLSQFRAEGGFADDNGGLVDSSFDLFDQVSDGNEMPEIIKRTYEVFDSCDNRAFCTQVIIVYKNAQIQMTCPDPLLFDCGIDRIPAPFASYAAYVAAGGHAQSTFYEIDPASFKFLGEVSDGNHCPEVITHTYSVKNTNGDEATCRHLIIIQDVTPPEMFIFGKAFERIEDIQPIYTSVGQLINNGGYAKDECQIDESSFKFVSESIDEVECQLIIKRIYEIKDMCGNSAQAIERLIVSDPIPPQFIKIPNDTTTECAPSTFMAKFTDFISLGGEVYDNCAVDSSSFSMIRQVVTNPDACPTTYIMTYRIADYNGNIDTFTWRATVYDTIPPVMSCPPDLALSLESPTPAAFTTLAQFIAAGGTASDNCGLDNNFFTLVSMFEFEETCAITVTYTYLVADFCGNSDTCSHTIFKKDISPPLISCPPNIYVNSLKNIPERFYSVSAFVEAGGSISDNCEIDSTSFSLISEFMDTITEPDILKRTYYIADKNMNDDICLHQIIIDDPTLSGSVHKQNFICNIYPNPNEGIFTLKINGLKENTVALKVFNSNGQQIYNKKLLAKTNCIDHQINLTGYAKGIYYIKINEGLNFGIKSVIVQ